MSLLEVVCHPKKEILLLDDYKIHKPHILIYCFEFHGGFCKPPYIKKGGVAWASLKRCPTPWCLVVLGRFPMLQGFHPVSRIEFGD